MREVFGRGDFFFLDKLTKNPKLEFFFFLFFFGGGGGGVGAVGGGGELENKLFQMALLLSKLCQIILLKSMHNCRRKKLSLPFKF